MRHDYELTTNYLRSVLQPDRLRNRLTWAKKVLAMYEYDSLAFCGLSGALFVSILAHELDKPMLLVRKENESSAHYPPPVEGYNHPQKYVFVDDQISTGATRERVLRQLSFFNAGNRHVLTLLYNEMQVIETENTKRVAGVFDSDVAGLSSDPND